MVAPFRNLQRKSKLFSILIARYYSIKRLVRINFSYAILGHLIKRNGII
jgi:hypothetical protein